MSKRVIITGSQGNLGSAVTSKFDKEGFEVLGAVEPGKLDDKNKGNIHFEEVDILDAEEVAQWALNTKKEKDTIDAIVCLVGGFGMGELLKSSKSDINKMINLNFFSAFNVVSAFLNQYSHQKSPINVVLIGAKPAVEKDGFKGLFPYALSKSMVIDLAKAINSDFENTNAHASVVIPSIIDTPPNRESMPDANFKDWVTPESIADKIYFACSEQSKDLRSIVLKVYGNS